MRNIHKITNIALIFMLWLMLKPSYALEHFNTLRLPIGNEDDTLKTMRQAMDSVSDNSGDIELYLSKLVSKYKWERDNAREELVKLKDRGVADRVIAIAENNDVGPKIKSWVVEIFREPGFISLNIEDRLIKLMLDGSREKEMLSRRPISTKEIELVIELRNFRCAIARVLGNAGASDTTVDGLVRASVDKEPLVRDTAAEALGETWSRKASKRLLELLNDEKEFVRLTAVKALEKIRDPETV